jgi:hypothetical protein
MSLTGYEIAMFIHDEYIGGDDPFYSKIREYDDYLTVRRWRTNIRQAREWHDNGTRPIEYPKKLL